MTERELLRRAAELAADHLDTLETRPVYPRASVDELPRELDVPLPDGPTDALEVIEELARDAEPGADRDGERPLLRLRHRRRRSRPRSRPTG